jgi:dTDP-4-amino-4,6-dideoxygalactose transaminase
MTMIDWQVPLGSAEVPEEDLKALCDVYRSGWLSMGPRTAELESAFADYTGSAHCVAVSSCSAALHLACLATGIGPGDRVIVPSITFVATANAIAYCGAEPVFADISSETEPWLSKETVAAAIDERTRAILTVCYGGHPGEIVGLRELAKSDGLTLIEDAAHGAGAWSEGKHVGTFGQVGAFSFSASKQMSVGEGGMIATDDPRLARRFERLRWHGISKSSWARHRQTVSEYQVDDLGFNYRLDDPRAALALARLRRLEDETVRRAQIDAAYRRDLEGLEGIEPTAPSPPGSRAGHLMFTVVLDEGVNRDRFRRFLAQRGVQTSVHFTPVHRLALYSGVDASLPRSESYGRRTVSLPMFPGLEDWQRELVVESVADALGSGSHRNGRRPGDRARVGTRRAPDRTTGRG